MAEREDNIVLAIDIGGTFTDLVLLDGGDGRVMAGKVLTTYPDPSAGVLEGVQALLGQWEVAPEDVKRAIHGTTLVTNALIERKGARTGLITTEGFRDALEIGREGRYDIYDLFLERPQPLVERHLRCEVPERLDVKGQVLVPLDEAALQRACETLRLQDVEAVGIVFLHAYVNPAHELRAAEMVAQLLPGVAVSVSHRVAPEFREYERTSTTVANAYVQPLAARYLQGLEQGLHQSGVQAPLHIMLSNGGSSAADVAAEFPVRLVESGPSGGALSGAYWGGMVGAGEVMAFDMGGTTAKAVLSQEGAFPLATESEVARVYRFKKGSGLPLLVPVMDMIEIGAGGGSIARLNEMGLPAVGPESAGAAPGPACYGLGGKEPTVTDADLLLGLLNEDYFLGGKMQLQMDKAKAAVEPLAQALGMEVERMAWGIRQLVDENMAGAARVHAAERGIDIRNYTLVATGGAGPVHACSLAQRLGIGTVVVPPAAGVGSAFGLLLAPIAFDFARTYVMRLEEVDPVRLGALLAEMEEEGRQIVAEAGVAPEQVQVKRMADLRYVGQGHEIRVVVEDGKIGGDVVQQLQEVFDREYVRLYGRLCTGVMVEAVNWRVNVSGPRPEPPPVRILQEGGGQTAALKDERAVLFDVEGGRVATPVYNRYGLRSGFAAVGPIIVEEAESTTVVLPRWHLQVDEANSLILTRSEA